MALIVAVNAAMQITPNKFKSGSIVTFLFNFSITIRRAFCPRKFMIAGEKFNSPELNESGFFYIIICNLKFLVFFQNICKLFDTVLAWAYRNGARGGQLPPLP